MGEVAELKSPIVEGKANVLTALQTVRGVLKAALAAVEDPQATPGLIIQALNSIPPAQQKFNSALLGFPMTTILPTGESVTD